MCLPVAAPAVFGPLSEGPQQRPACIGDGRNCSQSRTAPACPLGDPHGGRLYLGREVAENEPAACPS